MIKLFFLGLTRRGLSRKHKAASAGAGGRFGAGFPARRAVASGALAPARRGRVLDKKGRRARVFLKDAAS